MAATPKKDPTDPIRRKASRYPGAEQGTSCTQSSFKNGGKAYLYIGMQGGRYKAMFALQSSMSEAVKLAKKEPDRFEVGSTAWVTARFTAEKPMPKKVWEKWLDESYKLSLAAGTKKRATTKKPAKSKVSKKSATREKFAKQASSKPRRK